MGCSPSPWSPPVSLITGASKGIGRATAVELSRRGHRVIATAHDPGSLDCLDVDQRLRLDVTDQSSVDAAIQDAGGIDALISNAGGIFTAAVEASPSSRSNASSPRIPLGRSTSPRPSFHRCATVRRAGCSSSLAHLVEPSRPAPPPTRPGKWALEAFAEGLAIELSGTSIDITLAEPGPVSSGSLDNVRSYNLPDDPYASLLAGGPTPADIMISPEQVAAALADLVERPTVPLRVPVGPTAEHTLAARDATPYDRPFIHP